MKFIQAISVALLILGNTMAEEKKISAKEVILKSIEAVGGKAACKRFESAHAVGELKMFADDKIIAVHFESWCVPPLLLRREFTKEEFGKQVKSIYVLNKDNAWYKHGKNPTIPITGSDFERYKSTCADILFLSLYRIVEDEQFQICLLDSVLKNDEQCYQVLVRRDGNSDKTLCFSMKTYLLTSESEVKKINGSDQNEKVEVVFSEYRKFGDKMIPCKTIQYTDSKKVAVCKLKSITPIDKPDDNLFKKPE